MFGRWIGWYGIFTMICQKSTTILKKLYQNFSMYFMSVLRDFLEFHFWGVMPVLRKVRDGSCLKYEFIWFGNMNSYLLFKNREIRSNTLVSEKWNANITPSRVTPSRVTYCFWAVPLSHLLWFSLSCVHTLSSIRLLCHTT